MAAKKKSSKKVTKKGVFRIIGKIVIWFFLVTVIWVIAYRFINPPITFLMIMKKVSAPASTPPIKKKWVNLENISNNLKRAAIAGEDEKFYSHFGFDFTAIEHAAKNNLNGKKIKGGSTITQQTAKNVFLWPGRSWVRKGFEAYFTLLIEIFWSKDRILEVYLNMIEMGNGVYGAEAASRKFYNKSAKQISKAESALLVACFPNPIRWSPSRPTAYIYRKQSIIMRKMRTVKLP